MENSLFDQLYLQGLISKSSLDKSKIHYAKPVISLHYDLRALLYAGVCILSAGLAILIYKNFESIGHIAILSLVALVCLFCYGYCFKKAAPFSWNKVESPDILFDYLHLLGALLLVTFIEYLQYQYKVFGIHGNLSTFVPMVLLFISAYYFDHAGVLFMAITNLAAWLGLTVNDLTNPNNPVWKAEQSIYTAVSLGVVLIGIAYLSETIRRKAHFNKVYHQYGTHLFFISNFFAIAFFDPAYWKWLLLLLAGGIFHLYKAFRVSSFYYLVVAVLYMYAGISYVGIDLFEKLKFSEKSTLEINLLYFIVSAALLAFLLVRLNKKLRKHAGVQ